MPVPPAARVSALGRVHVRRVHMRRVHARRVHARRLLAALVLAGVALTGAAGAAHAAVTAPAHPASSPGLPDRLVLVGVGDLHWSDVDRTATPALLDMVRNGSVGSISVRVAGPLTCPLDAWLSLSAGRRVPSPDGASPPAVQEPEAADLTGACPPLPVLAPTASSTPSAHVVAGWDVLRDGSAPLGETGGIGTVGQRVGDAACSTAIGPGAGLMLADASGAVARYAGDLGALTRDDVTACPVTVVDAGELSQDRARRQGDLARLDDALRRLTRDVPAGTAVVVAGVSETPTGESGLQVVVEWRRGGGPVGWLTSESTRRTGIVTLADLAASAVAVAGGETDDLDGSPLVVDSERRISADRTIENRRYLTEMTTITPHLLPIVLGTVVGAGVLALLTIVVAHLRGRALGPAVRRVVVTTLLLGGATPAGAQLAALTRWWVWPAPQFAATLSYVAGTVLTALVAWLVSRLLPPGRWRLAGAAAAVVWLVLTVDGVTGTVLQQGSILGSAPTLGARYYGFGNTTFGVYAAAALVLAGALAAAARARRGLAAGAVLALGVVTVVVDGWPTFGADFGGVLALVPAFVVLLLGVLGSTLTWRRLLVAFGAAVLVAAMLAVVDWARPGRSTHLGLFVQRVLEGDAWSTIGSKAAGAWATVSVPVGALAAVACVVVCVLLVGPQRVRPPVLARAYATWPVLRPVLVAVVVVAVLGAFLNDSGVIVAVAVLGVAGAFLVASACSDAWDLGGARQDALTGPSVRRMPSVVAACGAGLLVVLLVVAAAVPPVSVTAGDTTSGEGPAAIPADRPVVLVGTSGVAWSDVDQTSTPTLWRLLRDGAAAAGVAPGVTGAASRCDSAGWLALSAGRAPVTGEYMDGVWTCEPLDVRPTGEGASVDGWAPLAGIQSRSAYKPRLGLLGTAFDERTCATAVGPGAALALGRTDGAVARYRTLDAALADPADAFSCPVTVVDAGSAVPPPLPPGAPADPARRPLALQAVDRRVRDILAEVPSAATVALVDVGNPARQRPALGIGLVDDAQHHTAGFLSTPSTRWVGVVRLLDLPTTLLSGRGLSVPADFSGSPLTVAAERQPDVAGVVAELTDLTRRDHALRGVSGTVTGTPMFVSLAVVLLAALLGPRLARRRPAVEVRLRRAADVVLLLAASVPAAAYLMTTSSWWRFGAATGAMWLALAGATVLVAGAAGLVARRPSTAGPGLLAVATYGLLTLDALLGTPLHRGSPLGPAVTLGGRYYGFGNPSYSIYVVAALVGAGVLGVWLRERGLRRTAVLVAAAMCGSAFVVDLWPSFGADVGGGLVLLPAGLVVVLAVAGVRITWQRLALTTLAGVVLVGGIAVVDWRRPPADRTHLGTFVQSVIDGTAWQTISRKMHFALDTVTSGPTAWLTLAVLALVVAVVWPRSRVHVPGWAAIQQQWPVARQVVGALLLAAVGGALVNDYGVRIATVMLFAAVPLFGMLGLRSAPTPDEPGYPASTPAARGGS